jgi:hypothetical protein
MREQNCNYCNNVFFPSGSIASLYGFCSINCQEQDKLKSGRIGINSVSK